MTTVSELRQRLARASGETGLLSITDARRLLARASGEIWRIPEVSAPPVFDPEPYRRHLQRIADEFGITIHPSTDAYAKGQRQIWTPWPPTTEAEVATAAHEIGHCLQPPCSGGDHYRDPDGGCIPCETSAATLAPVLLRPLKWTACMHERAVFGLKSYRRTTKGTPHALAQLDRYITNLTFCKIQQLALVASMRPATPIRTRSWAEEREIDRWHDFLSTPIDARVKLVR